MRARMLTKHLLWIGLPFLTSYFLADFSLKLSFALSIIFWLFFARTQQIWEYLAVQERFEPFRVQVTPKWAELLRDYKLVESREQLREVFARAREQPARFNVLSHGFTFTVLRPTPGWTDFRGLLYLDNHERFASAVDLLSRVAGEDSDLDRVVNDDDRPRIPGTSLSAFVRWGTDGGFDLGIEVNDDWWKQFCDTAGNKELTTIKTHHDHLCGTVRLIIATLPYGEFGMYLGSEEYSLKRAEREQQERDSILATFGWKRHEETDEETRHVFDPPNEIEHKYFMVSHRAI